jgi:hypothetical protein
VSSPRSIRSVEPVVGQIPAQQHDVRLRRAGGDVVEGPAQSGGRLVGGPDMAIAQVRDDEPCHAGERTETQLDSPGDELADVPDQLGRSCMVISQSNATGWTADSSRALAPAWSTQHSQSSAFGGALRRVGVGPAVDVLGRPASSARTCS